MDSFAGCAIRDCFTDLPDPRIERAKRHDLLAVVTIALCAVICGADSWVEVERFGRAKRAWLETFLPMPNGIPSHDTFGWVFAALDPAAFARSFLGWAQALVTATDGAVVAIDSKTLRRSHDRTHDREALHLVSAWSTANGVVLGQVATDDRSNEITAISALLDALALEGTVVTIDAMGCQTAFARQIVAGGGDDVLALKDNQPTLRELVAHHFAVTATLPDPGQTRRRTVGKDHGRIEIRTCQATNNPRVLAWLDPERRWPGRRSIAAVTGERRIGDQTTIQTRYYLTSLPADPRQIGEAVRAHWGIENGLHWVLDMAFREDESRVRTGHAAQNLAVLRRLALTLLRRGTTAKVGVKAKRLMCSWDETYLAPVLAA
ncbi:MAG: ISAs1 family transposase [Chloroflexota bacterium]|nr:ISAs1 family transposase [Chloroflexota bacterium]